MSRLSLAVRFNSASRRPPCWRDGKVWTAGRSPPSCSPFAIHGWAYRTHVLASGVKPNRERRNKCAEAALPVHRADAASASSSIHRLAFESTPPRGAAGILSGSLGARTRREGGGRNQIASRSPGHEGAQRRCRNPSRLTPMSENGACDIAWAVRAVHGLRRDGVHAAQETTWGRHRGGNNVRACAPLRFPRRVSERHTTKVCLCVQVCRRGLPRIASPRRRWSPATRA